MRGTAIDMEWRLFPGEWYLDAGALLLALALDLALRELPGAVHPVVWMGRFVSWLERLGPSPGARWPALAWGGLIAVTVPCLFGGAAWAAAPRLRTGSGSMTLANGKWRRGSEWNGVSCWCGSWKSGERV